MTSVLLLSCPDQPGIVAATSQAIADQGGNIVHAEQYVERSAGDTPTVFFQRIEFDLDASTNHPAFQSAFAPTAEQFGMTVDLRDRSIPIPTAIMAS